MPKYLIRCGKLPYEQYEPIDYLRRNLMGTNVGNYVYLYGIIRTLMTDENVTFESTRYRYRFSDAEIARFNEECTAFLIPLADAFRASFIKELVGLTELVQKLTIPCYVIGVGVSENFENLMQEGGKCGYEEESSAFVKAVLEKSVMLGVRGESTGEFLQKLGFQFERDYTVIGCPGFYTYGTHLKIRTPDIRPDVPVSMNLSCLCYAGNTGVFVAVGTVVSRFKATPHNSFLRHKYKNRQQKKLRVNRTIQIFITKAHEIKLPEIFCQPDTDSPMRT